ncbi:hypothetical protein A9Q99_21425 [Gammaproteobacteria bacterium 45_16_T64]|nr:hypothetical protein A9Q99_21425 [Gammaproteobacteria bacterium 45_16_T64]
MSEHKNTVTREDLLAQLEEMKSAVIDDNAGIFGPGSMFWQIGKYSSSFLGAGRAALLQVAHPWVANGIKQHSRTVDDPMSRFRGTFSNVFTMVYGNIDQVMNSALNVHNIHTRIIGEIEQDSGAFKQGSRYDANSIDAMIWVHATLWETSVKMYELVVGPLSQQEKEQYYRETKMFAYLFGIPESRLPRNWGEFIDYNEAMWESDQLQVEAAGKEIASFIFHINPLLRPVLAPYEVMTSLMMPERLREQFEMPEDNTANRAMYESCLKVIQKTYPLMPRRVRYFPAYIEARRRLKGLHDPDWLTATMNKAMLGRARLVSA